MKKLFIGLLSLLSISSFAAEKSFYANVFSKSNIVMKKNGFLEKKEVEAIFTEEANKLDIEKAECLLKRISVSQNLLSAVGANRQLLNIGKSLVNIDNVDSSSVVELLEKSIESNLLLSAKYRLESDAFKNGTSYCFSQI